MILIFIIGNTSYNFLCFVYHEFLTNKKLTGARGKSIVDITHFLVVERFYFIFICLKNK